MKTMYSRLRSFWVLPLLCAVLFAAAAPRAEAGTAPLTVDQDLVILLSDMSAEAVFYPAEVGGVVVEFFAVKAPDGTIRTVVNACQSCGPAGFTQIGDNFQCSLCGQNFHVSVIERHKGGCNPIPVGDQNKRVEKDRIVLPLAFLKQVAGSRYAKGRRG